MPATQTARALTSSMLRDLQIARPELADDCKRALRGCHSTQAELAHVLGVRAVRIPAPLVPGYARSGRWTDATGAGKVSYSNRR